MPKLGASLGVERVDVAERGGDVHHTADDDRRSLERFLDLRLKNPRGMKLGDVGDVDLAVRIEPRLREIAIGKEKIILIRRGALELRLGNRRCGDRLGLLVGDLIEFLRLRYRGSADASKHRERNEKAFFWFEHDLRPYRQSLRCAQFW
jgi:hypothetical protein